MKVALAFTVFAVNAHASFGPRTLDWFWLPGPPQVERMSPDEIVIAGSRENLEAERVAFDEAAKRDDVAQPGCAAELRCGPSPDAEASAAPCRMDVTSCLPRSLRTDLGALYAQPGPNCFSTALRASGLTSSVAGVDAPEMKAFARAFCVPVREPQSFDIGIYHAPGADAFAASTLWVHGFTHLSPGFVLEKQGVDYWGPTPVTLRGFSLMDHRVRISPECRRFSPDPSVCANRLIYLRCRPPEFPDTLTRALHQMDLVAARLLRLKQISPADFRLWDQAFARLETAAATENLETAHKDYVREKLASLRKQRQFFR